MSTIVRAVAASVSILSLAGPLSAAEPDAADAAGRAQRVLAAARQALGGEGALAAVHSLSLEGQLRRRVAGEDGEQEMSGDVRVDSLLPDRYLRVDTVSPMPGMPGIPLATGLDGDEVWSGALPVASGMNVVVRAAPPGDASAQGRLKDRILRESALFLVTLLAGANGTEYAWVGEAEAPEGRADVLHVMGRGGLDARLFVDQKSHRPLMLTFRDSPPRMMVRREMGPGGGHARPGGSAPPEALPTPPPPVEAALFLSDWKRVGGVLLPHALNKTLEGKPYEEIVVSRYTLNDPKVTADKFRKKV
ncbi:MAG TPA: hypothetical protein VIK51_17960 [Vicinamibacteria bacterium]